MNEKIIVKGNAKSASKILITMILITVACVIIDIPLFVTADEWMGWAMLVVVIALLVVDIFLYLYTKSGEITVTDKRVYGKAIFGARVDLPFDSISAVGNLPLWDGVSVASSSGMIKFVCIKNASEIYSVISNLLIERQKNNSKIDYKHNDTIEDIEKYNELFEKGIITEQEFNAKKKQLLGL